MAKRNQRRQRPRPNGLPLWLVVLAGVGTVALGLAVALGSRTGGAPPGPAVVVAVSARSPDTWGREYTVTLTDGGGGPVSGAAGSLTVDHLAMPGAHRVTVNLAPAGGGRYTAALSPLMPGPYRVEVDLVRPEPGVHAFQDEFHPGAAAAALIPAGPAGGTAVLAPSPPA